MKKLFMMTALAFASVGVLLAPAFATDTSNSFGQSSATAGIGLAGTGQDKGQSGLMTIIKTAINWVLGLLSLITLVVLLYGGFNMVTAAGDDKKYQSGFTILKQAGVGLAFIAVAWFVVSFIFGVLGSFTSSAG